MKRSLTTRVGLLIAAGAAAFVLSLVMRGGEKAV